jgi:pilus assembly protein CpaB
MRAVALRVNDVVGLAGFVLPGMHVDVVVSGGGQDNTITRTVLQNIEVLSAGQHVERTSDNQPREVQVVNLLVNPDQAEVLSLVSNETKVQLVLRNPLDTQEASTSGTSIAKIFGLKAPAAPVVVAPRPAAPEPKVAKVEPPEPTVEVFSGSKRSEQAIIGGAK